MVVRVQILAPFKYEFGSKVIWLNSGDSMYLDLSKAEQKEELKFILSSVFTFKEYVYLDMNSVPSNIKDECSANEGFYKLPEAVTLTEEPLIRNSFTLPAQEPEENPHLRPIGSAEPIPSFIVEEVEDCEVEANREDRLKELSATNWVKVRDLGESYGISYTNKAEVIQEILDFEFK